MSPSTNTMSTALRRLTQVAATSTVAVSLVLGPSAVAQGQAQAAPAGQQTAARVSAAAKPVAKMKFSKTALKVGGTVSVRTSGSKAPAGLKRVFVTFGDGTPRAGRAKLVSTFAHKYTRVGTFKVTLKLVDRKNRAATATRFVIVARAGGSHGTGAGTPEVDVKAGTLLPGAVGLPASVNLTANAMPVKDQGQMSSCVSWAITYAMLGWHLKQAGRGTIPFAPMYTYTQTNGGKDAGSWPKEALDVLRNQGADTAAHYGSGWATDWKTQPNASQRANAANYRITSYRTLFANKDGSGANAAAINAIKSELAGNRPVAITMELHQSFQNYNGGLYNRSGASLGAHEMVAMGYDAQGLLVQNSWGTNWGANGYVKLSWAAVSQEVYEAEVIDGLATNQSGGDATRPTVSVPTQRLVPDSVLGGNVPMSVVWNGADNSGSVAAYDLYASTNGGSWVRQSLPSQAATSTRYGLTPGNSYQFAISAVDAGGNRSDWSYGPKFTVAHHSDASGAISYVGSWFRSPWSEAAGGYLVHSSTVDDYARFTFTGRNAAWVGTAATNRGQARIYLDGDYWGVVDNYNGTTVARSFRFVVNSTVRATHTIDIQVVGTSGRPTVDVDSFVVFD